MRVLAQARQELTNERESADRERAELEARLKDRMREYEAADVKAFSAATAAGWTPEELRRIGFPEPDKKRRVRRRSTARSKQQKTAADSTDDAAPEGAGPVPDEQENGSGLNV